jgi:type III secretion protein T
MEYFFSQLKPIIIAITLCTPRFLTVFLITPFFNAEIITGVTRNCIVMAFSLIVFPTILPFVNTRDITVGLVLMIVTKEVIIGALIGYLAGLFFHSIAAVGQIIDHQRGAAFASLTDPGTGSETSPMGLLFSQITFVLFFTSGGFILFLSAMYESYRVWPIDTFWPQFDPGFARFFLVKLDEFMALAMLLASPMLIALFLSELGLGLINRFAPQLNVFFLSMPVKSAVGLLVLIFYLQFLLVFIKDGFIQRMDILTLLKQVVY